MIKVAIGGTKYGTYAYCVQAPGQHTFGACGTPHEAAEAVYGVIRFYAGHGALRGEALDSETIVRESEFAPLDQPKKELAPDAECPVCEAAV